MASHVWTSVCFRLAGNQFPGVPQACLSPLLPSASPSQELVSPFLLDLFFPCGQSWFACPLPCIASGLPGYLSLLFWRKQGAETGRPSEVSAGVGMSGPPTFSNVCCWAFFTWVSWPSDRVAGILLRVHAWVLLTPRALCNLQKAGQM